jgi:hypothetical protein
VLGIGAATGTGGAKMLIRPVNRVGLDGDDEGALRLDRLPSARLAVGPFNCETHSDHLHEDFTMGVIMSANLAAPFAEK